MSASATIVTYTVSNDNAEEFRRRVKEFLVPAARQAVGYQGFLLFDQAEDRRLAVVLYDSLEHAKAAQSIIGPVARDHVYALMSSPSVGVLSSVIIGDGVFASLEET